MTWPFENDTSAITKKLAKKSLQSEKRRNLMVVIAVALAAFLICFTGIVSTSLTQMQRNQVVDTYEAVWLGVEENDIENLKGVPEFERVGGYYVLGEELSEQGYHASYSSLCFRLRCAAWILFMRPAQSGQYFPRFDLGRKYPPHSVQRFLSARWSRAASSFPSSYGGSEPAAHKGIADTLHTYARLAVIQQDTVAGEIAQSPPALLDGHALL